MKIQMNKDITKYQKKLFAGIRPEELKGFAAVLAVMVPVILLLYFALGIPLIFAVFFGIVAGLPVTLICFFKPGDMPFLEYMRRSKEIRRFGTYTNISTETEDFYDRTQPEGDGGRGSDIENETWGNQMRISIGNTGASQ